MIKILVEFLLWFAKTETAKEISKNIYNKVVKSVDSRIENEDISHFLEQAVASKGNSLDVTILNDIKKATRSPELKQVLELSIDKIMSGK